MEFLRSIAALLVVVFLFKASYEIAYQQFKNFSIELAPPQIVEKIRIKVMSLSQIKGVHNIRTRYIGNLELSVEIDIEVDGSLSVWESHDIANSARDILKRKSILW